MLSSFPVETGSKAFNLFILGVENSISDISAYDTLQMIVVAMRKVRIWKIIFSSLVH